MNNRKMKVTHYLMSPKMAGRDILLWLSDARGIYIPRDFAKCFSDRNKNVSNVTDEEWAVLDAGPDHPEYWDVWASVLDDAVVTSNEGVEYFLHQDGDLWLVPCGMDWSEEDDTYIWPPEDEPDQVH